MQELSIDLETYSDVDISKCFLQIVLADRFTDNIYLKGKTMQELSIDLETYSDVDISKCGAYNGGT